MSVERAQAFFAAVAADPGLQRRVAGVQSKEQALEILQTAGYGDVTAEDLEAVVPADTEGELTDRQLDTVAGGGFDDVVQVINFCGGLISHLKL